MSVKEVILMSDGKRIERELGGNAEVVSAIMELTDRVDLLYKAVSQMSKGDAIDSVGPVVEKAWEHTGSAVDVFSPVVSSVSSIYTSNSYSVVSGASTRMTVAQGYSLSATYSVKNYITLPLSKPVSNAAKVKVEYDTDESGCYYPLITFSGPLDKATATHVSTNTTLETTFRYTGTGSAQTQSTTRITTYMSTSTQTTLSKANRKELHFSFAPGDSCFSVGVSSRFKDDALTSMRSSVSTRSTVGNITNTRTFYNSVTSTFMSLTATNGAMSAILYTSRVFVTDGNAYSGTANVFNPNTAACRYLFNLIDYRIRES